MHRTSGFNSLPAFAGWSGSPESGSDVGSSTSGHCVDYSTERGCERELGEVTRNICMFFNSTGNSPSQLRALLVAKFLGSRLVPHTIHEELVTSRGAAYSYGS